MGWVTIIKEQSVLVSGTYVFETKLYLKCSGAAYGLSKKLRVEFLCDIYKSLNFWTSLDFFEALSCPIYGRELLMCVITVN